MSLTIASREVEGVSILDLDGRITLGEGSLQLRVAFRELLAKGAKDILLNLGDVYLIDSSGLGELVSAFTTARSQSAALKLLNPCTKVYELLKLTKLHTIFDLYDNETLAIAAFK